MLDLIGLAILLLFAAVGAFRGALATVLSLVTLVASYAAGIAAATRLGAPVGERLGLPALLGPPLAGTLGFLAAFVLLSLIVRLLCRAERERRGELPRDALDRVGGGLFGAVRGALVVVLVGWLALWLDAARTLRATPDATASSRPLAEGSAVGAVARTVVEVGVEAALSDAGAGGKLAARMLARPTDTLTAVQSIVDNPRIATLGNDRAFWTYVEHGAVDAALNRASFYRILHDPELRGELAQIGLIGPEAASDPGVFRQEAKQVLSDVGPRLRRLREDPELAELSNDPEVSALLAQGNVLGLLRHPGFQRVVSRALASNPAESG